MPFTELNYENAVIEIFQNTLKFAYVYGPDVSRDYSDPLFMDDLLPALQKINPKLPETALSVTTSGSERFIIVFEKKVIFATCL